MPAGWWSWGIIPKPIKKSARFERINTQLRAANSELERISRSDGLTGAANRRHLDAHLDPEWRSAARAGRPLSLIIIDVDHFKAYNDHYGHRSGDCARCAGSYS